MILLIDNYDSFTYNLVQRLGELDPNIDLQVFRNDKITLDRLEELRPTHIIVSPGPCTPREAGVSNEVIQRFAASVPILGVCLGHQCIGQVFGGDVVRNEPAHGKTSWIHHDNSGVMAGVSEPFEATRYHSLIVKRSSIPDELVVTAWTHDGVVMGLRHVKHPTYGVQFHPESVLTKEGKKVLGNFIRRAVKVSA